MICPKCCWKSEAFDQLSSVKLRFCKTLQILQNTSKMESLFCKTVSPQACNCTKKSTITGVFLWIYLRENIFSFLLFCFRKDKRSHRRCSVKKGVLKNCENFTENTCVGVSFLIKFFSRFLRTQISKNICCERLIVKRSIFFNSRSCFTS